MATDFSKYMNMPVNVKGENMWFSNVIKNLNLTIKDDFVVEITNQNSAIIEQHINDNASYNANFTGKIYEYHKNKNGGVFPTSGLNAEEALTDVVRMIDLENSTNIWRYKSKRPYIKNMVNFMINPESNFWDDLKNGRVDLIDRLLEQSGAKDNSGPKSLASKICKYLCEIMYGLDNYYINDGVVRRVLPYYLNYYGIEMPTRNKTKFDSMSYQDLFNCLEKVKEASKSNLKRTEIDHIMWYCYRYEDISESKS